MVYSKKFHLSFCKEDGIERQTMGGGRLVNE
jgi:hypothetical protein